MDDIGEILGKSLEEAQDTRRLYGAADGEPAVLVELPSTKFGVTQTRVVIEKNTLGGSCLIWGHPSYGVWGSYLWCGSYESQEILQIVNHNDTWGEDFLTPRFKNTTDTTAEWSTTGSLNFATGSETGRTAEIVLNPDREVTELFISSDGIGSFTYTAYIDESTAVTQNIPENTLTTLGSIGSSISIEIGSPTGTNNYLKLDFEDNLLDDSVGSHHGTGFDDPQDAKVWYQFNGNVVDNTVPRFDGVATNLIYAEKGNLGSAGIFDGTTYIELDEAAETFSGSDMSMFSWVKTNGSADCQTIIGFNDSAGSDIITFGVTAGSLGFYDGSGWQVVGSTLLNDGEWHAVGFNYDKTCGSFDLYLDNQIDGTGSVGPQILSTHRISIGQNYDLSGSQADYLTGSLDDVRIFDRINTTNEIDAIYTSGSFIDAKINKGIELNGVSNFASIDHSFDYEDGTIACWFKPDTFGSAMPLITKCDSTGSNSWGVQISDTGSLQIYDNIGGAGSEWYSTGIATGAWSHMTASLGSNGAQELYLNGALIETGSLSVGNMATFSGSLFIGQDGTGNKYFDGVIDDVRAFHKLFSLNETGSLYNSGSGTAYDITGETAPNTYLTNINVRYTLTPMITYIITLSCNEFVTGDLGSIIANSGSILLTSDVLSEAILVDNNNYIVNIGGFN